MPIDFQPYTKTFLPEQVTFIRNLPTDELNIHKMLVLHFELHHSIDDAQEMVRQHAEANICPTCRKDLGAGQAQRGKRKHIKACEKNGKMAKDAKAAMVVKESAEKEANKPRENTPTSERTQHASSTTPAATLGPPDSSTFPESSITALIIRKPTLASSSLYSSLKRKLDDADGPPSGDECLKLIASPKEITGDRLKISPVAKRPKLIECRVDVTITGLATYKDREGTISICTNGRIVQWRGHDRSDDTVMVNTASIVNLKQRKAGTKFGAALIVFTRQEEGSKPKKYLFKFTSPQNADKEANDIKEALTPFALTGRDALKNAEEGSSAAAEVSHQKLTTPSAPCAPMPEKVIDCSRFIISEQEAEYASSDLEIDSSDSSSKKQTKIAEPAQQLNKLALHREEHLIQQEYSEDDDAEENEVDNDELEKMFYNDEADAATSGSPKNEFFSGAPQVQNYG